MKWWRLFMCVAFCAATSCTVPQLTRSTKYLHCQRSLLHAVVSGALYYCDTTDPCSVELA
jgi:hypothetical protein